MLKKVLFCECHCDGCGELFEDEFTGYNTFPMPFDLTDGFIEQGWQEIDDNIHYCPSCYAKLKGGDY